MSTAINRSSIRILAAFSILVIAADTASAAIVAADNASNVAYTDGWQTGDNGGSGFAPWSFLITGSGNGFIDRTPGNSLGAPTFALTTGNGLDTSEAFRSLLVPLAVGQTLSANIKGSQLQNAPPNSIGNTFDLLTASGSYRFSLFTNNGFNNDHWSITGNLDTGIAAASSFHVEFTLASANTYNLVLSPVTGGAPFYTRTGATLAGTTGASIAKLRFSTYGTGNSAAYFFDDLMNSAPGIQGDYNNDQAVNAADYVTWRDRINDGNYYIWRANFGQPTGASTSLSGVANLPTAIPEPTEMAMLFIAIFVMTTWRLSARNSSDASIWLGRAGQVNQ